MTPTQHLVNQTRQAKLLPLFPKFRSRSGPEGHAIGMFYLAAAPAWHRSSRQPIIGIRRNPEFPRERYVTHEEYKAVWPLSLISVKALLDLVYRTLQRPEDILNWTLANIVTKTESNGDKVRVIGNDQGKTGTIVDIAITPEIDATLKSLKPKSGVEIGPGRTLIVNRKNRPYTYSGISSMLRRYIKKARINKEPIESFGFYDMKGKGATDM